MFSLMMFKRVVRQLFLVVSLFFALAAVNLSEAFIKADGFSIEEIDAATFDRIKGKKIL
ncbi:MAG: hypothetical protein ACI4M9_06645 [Succinivibrio sp.]